MSKSGQLIECVNPEHLYLGSIHYRQDSCLGYSDVYDKFAEQFMEAMVINLDRVMGIQPTNPGRRQRLVEAVSQKWRVRYHPKRPRRWVAIGAHGVATFTTLCDCMDWIWNYRRSARE